MPSKKIKLRKLLDKWNVDNATVSFTEAEKEISNIVSLLQEKLSVKEFSDILLKLGNLKSLIEQSKEMTQQELSNISDKILQLEQIQTTMSDTDKGQKEEIKDVLNNLEETKKSLITKDDIDTTKLEEKLLEEIKKLKAELLTRMSNMGGGGSMNQKVSVNGTVMSTKYADFNLVGSGVTATNNETTKQVDIDFSAVGGVDTVTNSDGTLTISPTTGAVVASRAAITGDVAVPAGSNTATLATVNANVGSFGSSTSIPSFTVNAKGLITAASGNVVIAPAGTLTGTTLASNVVTSSLTTIGTLVAGAVPASLVTAGTFGTGAYVMDTSLTNPILYGSSAANGDITIHGTSSATKTTSYVILQPDGGNVGIGTTTPSRTLDVEFSQGGTNAGGIQFNNIASGGNSWTWTIAATGDANSVTAGSAYLRDDTSGGAKLVIKTDGNVGIGTTSPGAILQVNNAAAASVNGNEIAQFGSVYSGGTAGYGGYISFTDLTSTAVGRIRSITESANNIGLSFYTYNSSLSEKVRINAAGNVGIGTTGPDKKLEINLGTADALRLTYNDANGSATTYMDTTVSSVGLTTFTGAGSAPSFSFAQNVTSPYFIRSVGNALTAAGTTRTDALQLAKEVNNVTTAAASTGVILPVGVIGMRITIFNAGANLIQVYASASETIDTVAGATGVPLTNAKRCDYFFVAANTWISAQLGVISA